MIAKALRYGAREIVRLFSRSRQVLWPKTLSLPITSVCDAECVMCGVWRQPGQVSLPPEVLRSALRDRLFRRVDCVGISGGEPSLYPFLPEAVDIVASTLPNIRHLSITTNGLPPERWSSFLPAIAESCRQHGVTFRLELSVDGLGEVHDRIRGRTGAFRQAMEVAELARPLGVPLQIQATVSSGNVYAMMRLLQFCRTRGDDFVVRLATPIERLQNFDSVSAAALTDGERSFFSDFLDSEELHEATASPLRRLFYRDLARRLRTGGARRAPCCFQGEAVLLCSNGDLFLCSRDREPIGNVREGSAHGFYFSERARRFMQRLRNDTCPHCLHDQTAPWPSVRLLGEALWHRGAFQRLRRAGQAVRILAVAAARLPAAWRQARKGGAAIEGKPFRSALLLGNYGGEHVGDAAILGGVLLRLRNERDLQRAWVASFRPDRTRRWLSSIEPAVPVEVIPYRWDALRESMGTAEALVMAGGPLMELPDLLLRHLGVVTDARRRGIPILLEGVGVGPFRREFSRRVARLIFRMADFVRVRSRPSLSSPLLTGLRPVLAPDPAFDYLETRRMADRTTERERSSMEEVLGGESGVLRIGLNLRPLWWVYSADPRADCRKTEQDFLAALAEGMKRFHRLRGGSVRYVFFPMNADAYGQSDLKAAFKLERALGGAVDFRVWEIEPGVDALLSLIRRLDAVVSERMHGSVFALSQNRPVMGIDYTIGGAGKVRDLFEDVSLGERVLPVRNFSPDAFCNLLSGMAAGEGRMR